MNTVYIEKVIRSCKTENHIASCNQWISRLLSRVGHLTYLHYEYLYSRVREMEKYLKRREKLRG